MVKGEKMMVTKKPKPASYEQQHQTRPDAQRLKEVTFLALSYSHTHTHPTLLYPVLRVRDSATLHTACCHF